MVIKTIAIVGANATGQVFARASALAGYETILEDVSREMLERGISAVDRLLQKASERGEIQSADRAAAMSRIAPIVGVENAIRCADLIIEAVPEELEMKPELFTIFDKFAKPGAIFASSTQTLSILDLSDVTVYRERCIGIRLRKTGPEDQYTLVSDRFELVPTELTSQETILACTEVVHRLALHGQR